MYQYDIAVCEHCCMLCRIHDGWLQNRPVLYQVYENDIPGSFPETCRLYTVTTTRKTRGPAEFSKLGNFLQFFSYSCASRPRRCDMTNYCDITHVYFYREYRQWISYRTNSGAPQHQCGQQQTTADTYSRPSHTNQTYTIKIQQSGRVLRKYGWGYKCHVVCYRLSMQGYRLFRDEMAA